MEADDWFSYFSLSSFIRYNTSVKTDFSSSVILIPFCYLDSILGQYFVSMAEMYGRVHIGSRDRRLVSFTLFTSFQDNEFVLHSL